MPDLIGGSHPDPLPYAPDCAECARLRAAEEAARAERDQSGDDCRVLARRHLRRAHGVATVARG